MDKWCNGCQLSKDVSEFHKNKAAPDGLQVRCKACIRDYQVRARERTSARQRARDSAFRAGVIKQYGGKCTCCGEAEYAFLTFDHVNDDGAEHRRSGVRHLAKWAARNGYPDSLQVLCWNCNMAKQNNPDGCPHGKRRSKPSRKLI